MAIWDNLKMNPTNILIGIGVAVAVPVVLPVVVTVVRPLAKAAIKGRHACGRQAGDAGVAVEDFDVAGDGAELVAVVNGDSFQSIDRAVNDQIRLIDGVLRLKQDRVINLRNI